MPLVPLPPNLAGRLDAGTARTERQERQTVAPGARVAPLPMVFSYPGVLASSVESPPWYPQQNITITGVRVSLLADASSDHVIEIGVDGAAVEQFTLSGGSSTAFAVASIRVGPGSYVTVKTITVADANLSVELAIQ